MARWVRAEGYMVKAGCGGRIEVKVGGCWLLYGEGKEEPAGAVYQGNKGIRLAVLWRTEEEWYKPGEYNNKRTQQGVKRTLVQKVMAYNSETNAWWQATNHDPWVWATPQCAHEGAKRPASITTTVTRSCPKAPHPTKPNHRKMPNRHQGQAGVKPNWGGVNTINKPNHRRRNLCKGKGRGKGKEGGKKGREEKRRRGSVCVCVCKARCKCVCSVCVCVKGK